MTAVMKNQLSCWAHSALQMTQAGLQSNPLVNRIYQTIESKCVQTGLTLTGQENVKPVFTRSEVANHCSFDSCWMVVNNKVFDVTSFLRIHPGGEDILMEYAGFDATSAFIDKGHSGDAYEMLADYFIGDVAPADWLPERPMT